MVDEEHNDDAPKQSSPWPLLILLGLVFLPGGILAFLLWGLLRFWRQRPSVIGLIAVQVAVLSSLFLLLSFNSFFTGVQALFTTFSWASLRATLWQLLPSWLSLSFLLGSLAGWLFAGFSARQMKANPYLIELNGSWRYHFKYRRTPWEYLSRKRKIRALENGLVVESDRAPLGLDEDSDEIVFRFDTEARKHTFITGASGSGKALHKDTLIPTQHGFKPVYAVMVGDIIYDESGRPTKVLEKFQPRTEDHYRIQLSNGETVNACGDHLWGVKEAWGGLTYRILSTRELAKSYKNYYISALRKPVMGVKETRVNSYLLGAWLAGGALAFGVIKKRDILRGENSQAYASFVDDLQRDGWLTTQGEVRSLIYDWLFSSIPARLRALDGALTVAGSYTLDGETKLTLPSFELASYLRSLVFSLGIQPSPIQEYEKAFFFQFSHSLAKRQKHSVFSITVGEVSRKRAPKRNLISFERIEPIEDNPEDYYCFTVDSPSHLFLFGKSFTPTHNTVTMQNLISADIETGKSVAVIDFKRDPEFASKLAAWAKDNGREFYQFVNGNPEDYDIPNSKGQCYYDPLKSGTPTAKSDMVLGMREYDSSAAVYKSAMQQLLQTIFGMLTYAKREQCPSIDWDHGGIFQLASVVSGNGISELAAANMVQVAPGSSKWTYSPPGEGGLNGSKIIYVNSPIAKQAAELVEALRVKGSPLLHALEELRGQMRTIIVSEYGQWMKTGNQPGDREINLYDALGKDGSVVLFSLNSDSEKDFAQFVGAMILADLTNISALRRNTGANNQVNIYIDEFQAVPPTAVTSLLEKSRASFMAMTLAQQSFDQVVASAKTAGEAYLNSILDTCSNFIAHAGSTEKSATRLSEIVGKEFVTVYSRTNDSNSSFLSFNFARNTRSKVASRQEERWKFPPSKFMNLSSADPSNHHKSTMVWLTKTSADPKYAGRGGTTARTVWVIPEARVLNKYYQGATTTLRKPQVEPILEIEPLLEEQPEEFSPPEDEFEEISSVGEEDEEWNFEELSDEELKQEALPTVAPIKEVETREESTSSYDLDDLFSGAGIPEQKESPSPKSLPPVLPPHPLVQRKPGGGLPSRPGGIPIRPGGGLPTVPRKPTEEDDDSTDINFLTLPDL